MVFPEFGGIAGQNELAGIISGCTARLNINLSMPAMKGCVGGIAGLNIGTIEKCVSNGIISVTQKTALLILFMSVVLPVKPKNSVVWVV